MGNYRKNELMMNVNYEVGGLYLFRGLLCLHVVLSCVSLVQRSPTVCV
jgi:hypothetical protein